MTSVGGWEGPPRLTVQFVGGGGSICIEIDTEREAEEIPRKNWGQAKDAPVLREVVF